jgi:hypothetical protein
VESQIIKEIHIIMPFKILSPLLFQILIALIKVLKAPEVRH